MTCSTAPTTQDALEIASVEFRLAKRLRLQVTNKEGKGNGDEATRANPVRAMTVLRLVKGKGSSRYVM